MATFTEDKLHFGDFENNENCFYFSSTPTDSELCIRTNTSDSINEIVCIIAKKDIPDIIEFLKSVKDGSI